MRLEPREPFPGGPIGDPPTEPSNPLVVDLRFIDTPASWKGPWNGVTVVVKGEAQITSGTGSIEKVLVAFGDAAPVSAVQDAGGWAKWSTSQLVTYSGTVQVAIRAMVSGKIAAERKLQITTELEPRVGTEPPKTDTTPPVVAISSHRDRTTMLMFDSSLPIELSGTASDVGSGIARVEVSIDGTPANVVAGANGSWQTWTAKGKLVGLGDHLVTARAVDLQQNESKASVALLTTDTPTAPPVIERLFLVEKCRLSSFPGACGPGRIVKTIPMAPGEKIQFKVATFRRTTETIRETQNILDFSSRETQDDFENEVTLEQSNKAATQDEWRASVDAAGELSAPWGRASINVGLTSASNASREDMAKSISRALQKHVAKSSSKRQLEIQTTREMKTEEGEDRSTDSVVENINVSRTLNLVMSQICQEYISVLHLTDVRIGYLRGDLTNTEVQGQSTIQYTYREATLSQLDGLLRMVIVPERRDEVRDGIVKMLSHVFDYQDTPHAMIEERVLTDASGAPLTNGRYLRVPKQTMPYKDPATKAELFRVPGVILAATTNVVPTDGIVCDGFLGAGSMLDDYSRGLQREAVEAKSLENDRQRAALQKDRLALDIIQRRDLEAAKIFKELYPAPQTESLALVTAGDQTPAAIA